MRRHYLISGMVKSTSSRGLSKILLFNMGKDEGSGPFRIPWKYSLNISTTWVGESAAEPSGSLRASLRDCLCRRMYLYRYFGLSREIFKVRSWDWALYFRISSRQLLRTFLNASASHSSRVCRYLAKRGRRKSCQR